MDEFEWRLDNDLRYGVHVGLQANLADTLTSIGPLKTCQMYLGSGRGWSGRTLTRDDIATSATYCRNRDIDFLVHSTLISNLAHSAREDVRQNTINSLNHTMEQLRDLPGAVVLHVGKCGTLSNVIKHTNELVIPRAVDRQKASLLFENGAGQGTELGANWDELRLLFEGIDSVSGRVGLCLDTCHMFAAGMCEFRGDESVVKIFDKADEICPKGMLAFHLNDSVKGYNSRVNRHAPLGTGNIWGVRGAEEKSAISSLGMLVSIARERECNLICETSDPWSDLGILARYSEM